jgi:PPOX class probable F420-dependent enzyme
MLDTTTEAGACAEARLQEELIVSLTTVRFDGQPQSVAVWFLWDGDTLLFYPRAGQKKLKNIGANPRVGLHLNSSARGGDVVRVEGVAEAAPDIPPADEVGEYTESISRIGLDPAGFALTYSVALRVMPDHWHVW